jgi:hypothetical protein
MHCIDKHQFPRDYDFFIVNDGIDRRGSMLRAPHRRRSSAFSSLGDSAGRRRGESITSTTVEDMHLVHDEDEDEDDDGDESKGQTVKDADARRIPVKLRGRGGFSHPPGRGRGRGTSVTHDLLKSTSASPPAADSVDSLTSSMSALQFVPHSVRIAQGRGRGRGRV